MEPTSTNEGEKVKSAQPGSLPSVSAFGEARSRQSTSRRSYGRFSNYSFDMLLSFS